MKCSKTVDERFGCGLFGLLLPASRFPSHVIVRLCVCLFPLKPLLLLSSVPRGLPSPSSTRCAPDPPPEDMTSRAVYCPLATNTRRSVPSFRVSLLLLFEEPSCSPPASKNHECSLARLTVGAVQPVPSEALVQLVSVSTHFSHLFQNIGPAFITVQ